MKKITTHEKHYYNSEQVAYAVHRCLCGGMSPTPSQTQKGFIDLRM